MKSRLDSLNFQTSVVTLFLIALSAFGIEINLNAEDVVRELIAKNMDWIVTIGAPSLVTIVFKLVKKVQEKSLHFKDLFKSLNFVTQLGTVVLVLLSGIGIMFPPDASQSLVSAIFDGGFIAIATAVVINIINPLWHFFFDKPKTVQA